jgi:hypothetical protein
MAGDVLLAGPNARLAPTTFDEELLLARGELTWRAGAHGWRRGRDLPRHRRQWLCVPEDFERTDDKRWLERPRRFAVHTLEQVERRGRGRYALFTGDIGVALYAADRLDERGNYPITDTWD